jgi:hypothetical protein
MTAPLASLSHGLLELAARSDNGLGKGKAIQSLPNAQLARQSYQRGLNTMAELLSPFSFDLGRCS